MCALYPDLMNIYADRGNLLLLERRCRWRGIGFAAARASGLGDAARPRRRRPVLHRRRPGPRPEAVRRRSGRAQARRPARRAPRAARSILAVCGGYQLLGHSYQLGDETLPGVGLVDLRHGARRRAAADRQRRDRGRARARATAGCWPGSRTTAAARTSGPDAEPLGRVLNGHGNDGHSGYEGARGGNVIGTYLHGPLLPKNAWFADWLIATRARARARRWPRSTTSSRTPPTPRRGARPGSDGALTGYERSRPDRPRDARADVRRRSPGLRRRARLDLRRHARGELRGSGPPAASAEHQPASTTTVDHRRRPARPPRATPPLPGHRQAGGDDRRQELHRAVRARRALPPGAPGAGLHACSSTRTSAPPTSRCRRCKTGSLAMYPEYLNVFDTAVADVPPRLPHRAGRLSWPPSATRWPTGWAARPDAVQRHRRDRGDGRLRAGQPPAARWRPAPGRRRPLTVGGPPQFQQSPPGLPALERALRLHRRRLQGRSRSATSTRR